MKKIFTLFAALSMVMAMMAVNMTGGEKLYLTPNSNWKVDNARFAIYVFGEGGDAWADMTAVATDVYEATIPSGNWKNVVFCRMNPSATENNWGNKWNQTNDLEYDGTNNHYTIADDAWDNGNGSWSVYDPEAIPTYYITGNGALVGDEWKVDAIKMDYNEDSKLYTHTFNTLAANEYQLKITNGSWAESWGASNIDGAYAEIKGGDGNNIVITLTQATTLTVKFDAEAKKISFEGLTVIESVISYVLMGVGGDWATGIEMTQNPDNENEYQLIGQPISEGDVVKVATKNNSITVAWCNKVDEASVEHKWTNDGNIILAPGKYNFFYKVKEDLIYILAATESAVDNVVVEKKATKIIRNGQMYILRNGVMYNSVGQVAE